jgi:hypothetical protein
MTSVGDVVARRGITEVLHFTTNRGLVGILDTGAVLSRNRLSRERRLEYIYMYNTSYREDEEWFDYVHLSISKINTSFFDHSLDEHANDDLWWCALAFDPGILSDDGVFFATTNNIFDDCRREQGPAGLEALFAERVDREKGEFVTREAEMPDNLPTCLQAEAMYFDELPLDRLLKIYVGEGRHADIAASNREIFLRPAEPAEKVPIVIDLHAFKP